MLKRDQIIVYIKRCPENKLVIKQNKKHELKMSKYSEIKSRVHLDVHAIVFRI
jgi:hypothetical protein